MVYGTQQRQDSFHDVREVIIRFLYEVREYPRRCSGLEF